MYKRRWVLLRTKRRHLARTFAAETRGTSTSGTVRLRDLRSGKRYAGRYERRGQWLHIHTARANKLLGKAQKHLWRSCFLRQRAGRRYLQFWYLVTDPRDHKRIWQDRGRMLQVGAHWKINKL